MGSHCGHDCWSNGDKKHAVDNIVILYSIGLDLIDWFGLIGGWFACVGLAFHDSMRPPISLLECRAMFGLDWIGLDWR